MPSSANCIRYSILCQANISPAAHALNFPLQNRNFFKMMANKYDEGEFWKVIETDNKGFGVVTTKKIEKGRVFDGIFLKVSEPKC